MKSQLETRIINNNTFIALFLKTNIKIGGET